MMRAGRGVRHAALTLAAALLLLLGAAPALAWDVRCTTSQGGPECKDPFERVRTPWRDDPLAEHGTLLHQSIAYSGLPLTFLDPFDLTVYAGNQMFSGPDGSPYTTVNPVYSGVARTATRTVYIQGMANLPDFAYTLADWSSGAETCPPDSNNSDPLDCHNYETHIGWLNSNHMLPQSRKWYEHLHEIALNRARACKVAYDATPPGHRDRFEPYLLACEKLALSIEGVAHHYLQDSWALGHMWERWGSTEVADFGGNRALGFAIGAFTGLIHGAKAMLDTNSNTQALAPWDDPMNAPHPDGIYSDGGALFPGVGDLFLPELLSSPGDSFGPQRRALLGCEVDGLRAVYDATAKVHGPLSAASVANIDLSRSVTDDSCWNQRATNRAIAAGMGIHNGTAPNEVRISQYELIPLIMAISNVAPGLAGAPEMDPATRQQFNVTAAAAAGLALGLAMDPGTAIGDDTFLARGGLPALAGIGPNGTYARGNAAAGVPPASYADPFPPWKVKEPNLDLARRSVPLNLTFADANATDRCTELTTSDLEQLRDAVSDGRNAGLPADQVAARCGRCVQVLTPHLRFGTSGNFDARREAYCAVAAPGSTAFIYTGEPGPFTGQEPITFASLQDAASIVCRCVQVTVGLIPATTTLNLNQTRQYTAVVTGSANTAVTWSATGGSISSTGLYTGSTFGTFTVTATSVVDPAQSASATVSVVPTGGVVVSPARVALGFGKSRLFSTLGGTPPFTWSATGGTITQAGAFTAGNVEGEYSVVATSATGGSGVATAIIDRFIGVYSGSWQRFLPFGVTGTNAQFSITRFLSPRTECSFGNLACYNTGAMDLGTVTVGSCWFQPEVFGSSTVIGYCDPTSTSGGGAFRGVLSGTSFTWTLQRSFQGALVESWSFSMTRQ